MSISSDDHVKERIREAIDIVDLVSQYIPLRRSGRNYVGRCPWHDDSRPSLQVNPARQTFKCWVCDIGGDVFSFVMKIENVEFKEALEILADKTGIALPKKQKFVTNERKTGKESQTTEKTEFHTEYHDNTTNELQEIEITRKQLLQAADWLTKNYHEALLHLDEAEIARKYLAERGIDNNAIKKFQLGYAPREHEWLVQKVKRKPERLQILEIVGNLKKKNEDFFRGRLIFPIRDENGRTVAFGGRLIPNSPLSHDSWHKDRKYLNSSETTLFSKHKILYGLDLARHKIKETRRALIMEGYTDCIVAHQFGFSDAVAVLGTALGPAHIRLLSRLAADKIILMLDGDKAGQTKAESDQVLKDFIAEGADMAVLTLPEGLDPCEFLEQHGTEALELLLKTETVDALEHVFRAKTRGVDLKNDIIGASKALDSILEIVAFAPVKGTAPDNPIRFRIEKTIQNLSVRFLIPEDEIRRRLTEKQQKAKIEIQRHHNQEENVAEKNENTNSFWNDKTLLPDTLERDMLELWLTDPTAIYEFWETVPLERCRSPLTRIIYEKCNSLIEQNKPATCSRLIISFDDPAIKSFLVELDESGREKFFGGNDSEQPAYHDELEELGQTLRDETNEPQLDKELRAKLIQEIRDGFNRRDSERTKIADIGTLRNNNLPQTERVNKLLQMQELLKKQQEEKRKKFGSEN
ncbi:MAG: toprim domain-containing protein [Planctomycetaceae bacterium]|nr:toprim domain-containing protein [Planctomycetaceae bacterium]